jgi:adenylate kinase
VLSKRLASYRAQTEPLVHYYSEKRKLITVDGMMSIEQVTGAINRVLAALEADSAAKAEKKAATRKPAKAKKAAGKARIRRRPREPKAAKKAAKKVTKKTAKATARKAKGLKTSREGRQGGGEGPEKDRSEGQKPSGGNQTAKTRKVAKKTTKRPLKPSNG